MSKAVLFIDKPDSCHKCPLFKNHYSDMTCMGNGKTINYLYPDDKVQEWCPLKEVPQKKVIRNFCISNSDYEQKGYQTGYNTCIDEILAEKKE